MLVNAVLERIFVAGCGRETPGPAELDFFKSVHDLVKVEDEVGTVGDEEAVRTVKTWEVQVRVGQPFARK